MNSKRELWLNPNRALTVYAAIFSLFIAWASLRSALNPAHEHFPVLYLASCEIVGAGLFAWRKTRFVGLVILLVVFAIAAAIELHLREWPGRFVFYAASALFVQYLSVQLNRDR